MKTLWCKNQESPSDRISLAWAPLKGVTNENEQHRNRPPWCPMFFYLKGVTNEKGGGWGKDANIGYWSYCGDGCTFIFQFGHHSGKNIFPFPLSAAE
jgi:hypothetical protein